MAKKYTWDSISRRLSFEGKRLAEKNQQKPTGGNCHVLSVNIIVGCDGLPLGLLHPSLTKIEPCGNWISLTGICEDI